jgi:type I restriction enzyme S subunit
MRTVLIEQITYNLDSKRIPLNGSERAKRSQTKLYPYIGANNIVDYIDDYIFDEKILCVAEDGGSWGKSEICAKIYNEKCWVNNHTHVLTAKPDVILEYLASYLNYANLNSYITGTTRGKLTRKQLDSIKIPLPPLDDQKRIAYLLSKVEGLIAQRKQHLQQLDDLLKSVFLEMFGDPVRNEKGWEKTKIESFAHVGTGATPSRQKIDEYYNGDIPWVKTTEVKNEKIILTEEYADSRMKCIT